MKTYKVINHKNEVKGENLPIGQALDLYDSLGGCENGWKVVCQENTYQSEINSYPI